MKGHGGTRPVSPLRNDVLRKSREDRGWSRRRAVVELRRAAAAQGLPAMPEPESVERSMARHERGEVRPDALYLGLYCAIYGLSEQQVAGTLTPAAAEGTCGIRSHKFVMAQVATTEALALLEQGTPVPGAWFDCVSLPVGSPFGEATLYVWPFGALGFHLVESGCWDHITDLALWRVETYPKNLEWASGWLSEATGREASAAYALSAYWVDTPTWSGPDVTTAAHLLSTPKTLLRRSSCGDETERATGRMVERSHFQEGFRHPDVREFGVAGISAGAASWSGVSYIPLAPERGLAESDLVQCELAIQSLWTYCDHLSRAEEQGQPLDIADGYSWQFLRRARSRLNISRPQETGQHMSMRTALVETSGVSQLLDNTIEFLREG